MSVDSLRRGPTPESFEAFYQESRPRLIVALRAVSGSRDEAAESVDEAMTRAVERWGRVGALSSPEAWVFVTARNVLRRRARRTRLEQAWVRRSAQQSTSTTSDGSLVEFASAIESLPRAQRDVVVCRHVLGFTEPEIARALRIPRGTVSSRLRRAHARLLSQHEPAARNPTRPQRAPRRAPMTQTKGTTT